jgi:4-oxalocrotonate tautomerase
VLRAVFKAQGEWRHGIARRLALRRQRSWEERMPFVNIRIYEGHGKDRKDEIARRVTDAITDVCKLPREAVWVVFEEVSPPDWYVAGAPGKSAPR